MHDAFGHGQSTPGQGTDRESRLNESVPLMSLYKCNFCQDPLQPSPPARAEWLLTFILMRPYTCPHCRESYIRPILSLANYTGTPKSTSRKSTNTKGWKASPGAIRIKQPVEPKRSSSDSDPETSSERSSNDQHRRETEPESNRENDETGEREPEHRRTESQHRKERSRSSSRSSRQQREQKQVRRRDATISTLSNQSRPSKYRSNHVMARAYRKVRRRVRKMLGLSKSGRRSSKSRSNQKHDDNKRSRGSGRSSNQSTRLSKGKRSY